MNARMTIHRASTGILKRVRRRLACVAALGALVAGVAAQPASAHHGSWAYGPSYSGPWADWTSWTIATDNADGLLATFVDSDWGWYNTAICIGSDSCNYVQTTPRWMNAGENWSSLHCGSAPDHLLIGSWNNIVCPAIWGINAIPLYGTV